MKNIKNNYDSHEETNKPTVLYQIQNPEYWYAFKNHEKMNNFWIAYIKLNNI